MKIHEILYQQTIGDYTVAQMQTVSYFLALQLFIFSADARIFQLLTRQYSFVSMINVKVFSSCFCGLKEHLSL